MSAFDGYIPSAIDGTPLYYEGERQAGARLGLVLLDGIGCDGYVWPELRRQWGDVSVLHPHYRGHGRSRVPANFADVELADLAADAWTVVNHVGQSDRAPSNETEKLVLVGHSMGVQVALEMWAQRPNLVAGLVLLNGVAGEALATFAWPGLHTHLPTLRRTVDKGRRLFNWMSRRFVATRFFYDLATQLEIPGDLVSQTQFMPYLRGMSHMDASLFLALLAAMARHNRQADLPAIKVPTLIIGGSNDGMTPAAASRAMAAAIPQSDFLLIEGGTHTTPLEQPIAVGTAINAFLRRL